MTTDVYIVAAQRTAVTKSHKGSFTQFRPDDMLANLLTDVIAKTAIDAHLIDDVIIGCATPEAQQGMNIARISLLLAGFPESVPGFTINRFCASGLESIAVAAAKIKAGQADAILAGGVENMSLIPFGGHNISANPAIFGSDNKLLPVSYGMGLTAEAVAKKWQISREDQDAFALRSHQKAITAIDSNIFAKEITPLTLTTAKPDKNSTNIISSNTVIDKDFGPRRDTSLSILAKLKPIFAKDGSVTAGNSSQISDGASVLMLASGDFIKQHRLKPLAKFSAYKVAGLEPEYMGMGPVHAIPKALKMANLSINNIDHIELNEAFAAQALAVINSANLNMDVINPYGGAIALGHPLGATGAIKTTSLIHSLLRKEQRYGMVTMCVGTGMGAAGIFEAIL